MPKQMGFYVNLLKILVMTGIQYITDEKGNKQSIIIDLKKWGEYVEDFLDAIEAKQRKDEESESYSSVREKILNKKTA